MTVDGWMICTRMHGTFAHTGLGYLSALVKPDLTLSGTNVFRLGCAEPRVSGEARLPNRGALSENLRQLFPTDLNLQESLRAWKIRQSALKY